eukprot:m51a1_g13730 hypothetical protein (575) ;mRNA; f:136031-138710
MSSKRSRKASPRAPSAAAQRREWESLSFFARVRLQAEALSWAHHSRLGSASPVALAGWQLLRDVFWRYVAPLDPPLLVAYVPRSPPRQPPAVAVLRPGEGCGGHRDQLVDNFGSTPASYNDATSLVPVAHCAREVAVATTYETGYPSVPFVTVSVYDAQTGAPVTGPRREWESLSFFARVRLQAEALSWAHHSRLGSASPVALAGWQLLRDVFWRYVAPLDPPLLVAYVPRSPPRQPPAVAVLRPGEGCGGHRDQLVDNFGSTPASYNDATSLVPVAHCAREVAVATTYETGYPSVPFVTVSVYDAQTGAPVTGFSVRGLLGACTVRPDPSQQRLATACLSVTLHWDTRVVVVPLAGGEAFAVEPAAHFAPLSAAWVGDDLVCFVCARHAFLVDVCARAVTWSRSFGYRPYANEDHSLVAGSCLLYSDNKGSVHSVRLLGGAKGSGGSGALVPAHSVSVPHTDHRPPPLAAVGASLVAAYCLDRGIVTLIEVAEDGSLAVVNKFSSDNAVRCRQGASGAGSVMYFPSQNRGFPVMSVDMASGENLHKYVIGDQRDCSVAIMALSSRTEGSSDNQ